MNKIALALIGLLIAATTAFAVGGARDPVGYTSKQPTTQANINQEGQTNFGNVAALGLKSKGSSSYLVLQSCQVATLSNGDTLPCYPWYLWVSPAGNLCMASYLTISTYASFPSGDWTTSDTMKSACTAVGAQTAY